MQCKKQNSTQLNTSCPIVPTPLEVLVIHTELNILSGLKSDLLWWLNRNTASHCILCIDRILDHNAISYSRGIYKKMLGWNYAMEMMLWWKILSLCINKSFKINHLWQWVHLKKTFEFNIHEGGQNHSITFSMMIRILLAKKPIKVWSLMRRKNSRSHGTVIWSQLDRGKTLQCLQQTCSLFSQNMSAKALK